MADIPFYDLGPAARARRQQLHAALDSVIDGGYFVGGEPVSGFEREFALYVGVRECIGVGNGLDGLRLGLEALGIGPGDEVIVPAFTFYATWLAVLQVGATPVPVDVELATGGIDVSAIGAAITPRTRAIMVVHLFGIPADLASLRSLADDAGVALVEDAAQSHGARSGGSMTGSVGDVSAFSFYPTKNLGALGDGGAVVTNSPQLAATVRSRRSYGQGATKYEHVDTGWNSRLDSIQAAFLSGDLPQLDALNERRRWIASDYLAALGSESTAVLGREQHSASVWHHFVVRAADRAGLADHFRRLGIGTDIHYPYFFDTVAPMKPYSTGAPLPAAAALSAQVLSFPISPWLTDSEIARVADAFSTVPRHLLVSD